jgi:zinc D-Ala-D-Ala carboxypeptidase
VGGLMLLRKELDKNVWPEVERVLTYSSTAVRYGLSNKPTDEHVKNLKYLYSKVLYPLSTWYNKDIEINSGYRSPELNARVGGSPRSLHCFGCAVDIDGIGGASLLSIIEHIYFNMQFTELIAEYFPGGWVHVGIIKGRENDRVLKIKNKDFNFNQISIEFLRTVK